MATLLTSPYWAHDVIKISNHQEDEFGLGRSVFGNRFTDGGAGTDGTSSSLPFYKDYEFQVWDVRSFRAAKDDQSYLIDGLIPKGGHILLYAPTGHLKSFAAIDIACSISSGRTFHDKTTTYGEVIYIAAEAAEEIAFRIEAWNAFHRATTNIHFIDKALQLRDSMEMERLRRFVDSRAGRVKLIVIDTVSRCAIGTDENKPTEVNQYVNAPIENLIRNTGVSVLLVHHQGGSAGPRGCTAWSDPCDVVIKVQTAFTTRVSRAKPLAVTLQVEKQRRGEPGAFSFKPVKTKGTLVLSPISTADRASLSSTTPNNQPISARLAGREGKRKPSASQEIVSALQREGALPLRGVIEHTGLVKGTAKNTLGQMVQAGMLVREGGIYEIVGS